MDESIIELTREEISPHLSFPEEKLVIAKRQHPIVFLGPIIFSILISVAVIVFIYVISLNVFRSPIVFIGLSLLILIILIGLITKTVVDFYFHFYIVTDRQILEVIAVPFYKDRIFDVLLDQVRTTEIDSKIPSVLHEILDMGDVVIGFDRPSHEQQFVLTNIKAPRETELVLSKQLESIMHSAPIWFHPRGDMTPKYYEDVYPDKED